MEDRSWKLEVGRWKIEDRSWKMEDEVVEIKHGVLAELTAKMQEYVKMEDELEFAAFSAYYQDVMSCLQGDYQELSQDELIAAEAICSIMGANAAGRALKKDANRKKFQKMQEKSEFWAKAIKARLLKEGLTEAVINEKAEELWESAS